MTVGDVITLPHSGRYEAKLNNQQIADIMLDFYWSHRDAYLRDDPGVRQAVDAELDKLGAMTS